MRLTKRNAYAPAIKEKPGETFNFEGKTDVLIRAEGRNIFIGECKFWKGPQALKETIDQLLGYTSWRDTKTAILLFNRNRDLSAVLAKVPEVMAEHSNFERQIEYANETGFRFIFRQKNDGNRRVMITVLVFDIPVRPWPAPATASLIASAARSRR